MVEPYAVIDHTSPRYESLKLIFGSDRVPVHPNMVVGNGAEGQKSFYRADLSRVTLIQRQRYISLVSERWNIDPADVELDLDDPNHGLLILAEDVTMVMDLRMFA